MKPYCCLVGVVSLLLCVSAQAAPCLSVLAPGYTVETYAVYSCPGTTYHILGMAWDTSGNMYLSHEETYNPTSESYGPIYRITADRTATKWLIDIPLPAKMVWGGGSSYHDYLYVAGGVWGESAIYRVSPDGQVSTFAQVSRGPHPLALDRTGRYGGYMYTATRASDRTYRIEPDGSVSVFSQFPKPAEDGGGPIDIAFDPGTAYGGLMYMTTDYVNTPASSGLFALDTLGNATRFAPAILGGHSVDIDPLGLFSGDLFVTGRIGAGRDVPYSIWQVTPDGAISEFARTTGVPAGLRTFAFGPDGALYAPLFFPDEEIVLVSRIAPVPLPSAVLLGVLGLSVAGWRLKRRIS